MRYHYKAPEADTPVYGELYKCDHPVYNSCTLFRKGDRGLAIIQQRYNKFTKRSWWTSIDTSLWNPIYIHPKFDSYFERFAAQSIDGLYPTVTVRQAMWALKMKPLKRQAWETYFDHSPI